MKLDYLFQFLEYSTYCPFQNPLQMPRRLVIILPHSSNFFSLCPSLCRQQLLSMICYLCHYILVIKSSLKYSNDFVQKLTPPVNPKLHFQPQGSCSLPQSACESHSTEALHARGTARSLLFRCIRSHLVFQCQRLLGFHGLHVLKQCNLHRKLEPGRTLKGPGAPFSFTEEMRLVGFQ